MVSLLFHAIREIRPRQWIKNLSLYAALLFSGFFFKQGYFAAVTYAFVLFCLLSSAVYVVNDIIDAPQDRLHPFKKKRPIASGALSVKTATIMAAVLFLIVFVLASGISAIFFALCLSYALLHLWDWCR
jgi:4-hydroxybenzoate polyprenyltransferase